MTRTSIDAWAGRALVAAPFVAASASLATAFLPWYRFGTDAFTNPIDGWTSCPNSQYAVSYAGRFIVVFAIAVGAAALARRRGHPGTVGVVAAIAAATFGVAHAWGQLDGSATGQLCNGYDFEVLRPARMSVASMLVAFVGIAALSLARRFQPTAEATVRQRAKYMG